MAKVVSATPGVTSCSMKGAELNNKENKPRAKSEFRFGSLTLLMTNVYLGATVVVAGLAALGYFVVAGVAGEIAGAQAGETHKLLLQQVQQRLDGYIRPVEVLAADPQLDLLLATPEAIPARQQELAAIAGAQSLMLIAAGQEKDLLGEFPLLSYAELDLIHAAQGGEVPGVEYHELKEGQSHIDVVRPLIRNDGSGGRVIIGYLLARYESSAMLARLQELFQPSDRIELSQALSDGSTQLFMGWGDVALKGQAEAHSGNIGESSWQLSYWQLPHDWRIHGVSWQTLYWLLSGGVLAVLALALLVLWWLVDKRVRASGDKIYEYVWDRVNGHWMGKSYIVALSEVQPVIARLQNLDWKLPGGKSEADDITTPVVPVGTEATVAVAAPVPSASYANLLYQDNNVLEIEEEIAPPELEKRSANPQLPASIFRAYDIRGVVGETLTADIVYDIGRAFGSEAKEKGAQTIVVGRDGRLSSQSLASALIQGLCDSGRDVIDIGLVPTPVLYFATHYLSARSGIMVTGSHNPAEYNGLKLVLQGETLAEEGVQRLYHRIIGGNYVEPVSRGTVSQQSLTADYLARVAGDVNLGRELKVALDCGNGVAADVAPQLLRLLGCEVVELNCEVDGRFPSHHPDPSQPENLQELIAAVKRHNADIGIAFDGDGDRLGVVDSRGNILWPDRQLMLFAIDVLEDHPGGTIIYDVKSSRDLRRVIEGQGGQPLMWKSGHSLLKAKVKESGALLAGELSGHLFFNDRWYGFDDALYAMARLLEILARGTRSSADLFRVLPEAISTPELRVTLPEGGAAKLMERLKGQVRFPGAQIVTLDGIRAEFEDGWGLVRASNTSPSLTLRFEAVSVDALKRIQKLFSDALLALEPGLKLPF